MPFTPSHVVAILPLTRGRAGRHLDAAALAIGAMVPDLPYFVPPHVGSRWTHAWYGPLTLDLLLGLAVLALWRAARPTLVDLAPRLVRSRVGAGRPGGRPVRDLIAVGLGSLTHVVWDTFSHPGRWGTTHVAWLTEVHGPLAGYKWVQYGSGVVGLAVLAVWLVVWVRRTPARPLPIGRAPGRRRVVWLFVAVGLLAVVAWTWTTQAAVTGRWLDEATAVRLATRVISAALVGLLVAALAGLRIRAQRPVC